MSDPLVHDAFLTIVALPEEAREGELARLERRSPEIATEVRRMLPFYREDPADHDLDDDPADELAAPEGAGMIETFSTPELVDRRSSAPRIPGHRIVETIDHGGQSTVYLAEQTNPRRLVAVKVLRLAILDPRARDRFLAEAQLQGTIRHPAIVGIHASGVADDTGRPLPWISMELVPGARTISEAAKAEGWDRRRRIEALATVAEAVHAAHLRGVVHRDLKPGNILVDAEGRVRIIDFGIARLLDSADGDSLTRDGELVGTIRYLAPEQLRGDQIDARADIHALGVLAYELLHERSPWGDSATTSAIIAAIERHQIVHPRPRSRSDRDLNAVLTQSLAPAPADRYESMAAFARDLQALAGGNRVDARSAKSIDELRRFAARHPLPVWLSVMLLIAVIMALAASARFTTEAIAMRARGLVSQINAAVARGDLQMARLLLDEVPVGNRHFEYHLLAAEAEPDTIGRRSAWSALGNLYELESVPNAAEPLAVAAGSGRIAVLRLGTDVLVREFGIVGLDGGPPIGELVRITIDPSSTAETIRVAAVTSDGDIGCLEIDPGSTRRSLAPNSVLPRSDAADATRQRGLAFLDGDLAVGERDGVIEIHETGRNDAGRWFVRTKATRRIETGLDGQISAIASLPHGELVVGTGSGVVAILSATGEARTILADAARMVTRIVISPDGSSFLACAGRSLLSGGVDGSNVRSIDAGGLIWDASFSPSSNRVAITGRDGCIRILSSDDWLELANIRETRGVTWSSLWDESRLVVTTERDGIISVPNVRIEEAGGGGTDSRLFALSPSTATTLRQRDGRWIVRGLDDQLIAIHDGHDAAAIDPESIQSASIRDVDRDDDPTKLVAVAAIDGRGLVAIDGAGRQHLLLTSESAIREIRLASDGRRILWRTERPSAHIGRFDESSRFHHDVIDFPPREGAHPWIRNAGVVSLLELEPNELWVGCEDARIVDPEGRRSPRAFETRRLDAHGNPSAMSGWVLSIAGDPDGVAYVGNHNGVITCWERGTRHWLAESRRSMVIDLALHPDESRLAALHSNGMIDILDTADGLVVATLGPIAGEPASVAITPDGRTLIAHAVDGRHRAWTTRTPARTVVIEPRP